MDLQIYNGTSSLKKQAYTKLLEQLNSYPEDKLIRILEFGSGKSTRFFVDYKTIFNKNLEITSFENDINLGYHKQTEELCLTLNIRNLIECSDADFNNQMESKIFNKQLFYNKMTHLTWRQRNCIYNILSGDLSGIYDIIVIDGPNGNGRSLLNSIFSPYVASDTIILMDDYNSRDNEYDYKFVEHIYRFFNLEELYTHDGDSENTFEYGGNFKVFKIIDII